MANRRPSPFADSRLARRLLGLAVAAPLAWSLWSSAALPALAADAPVNYTPPDFSVEIPTVNLTSFETKSGDTIDIPWIAQYIVGVYQYAVGIAGILAAVMMMIGGLQIMTARGDASAAKAGKDKIQDAVIGVFLTLSVYTILKLVNPDLIAFKPVKIPTVSGIDFTSEPEEVEPQAVAVDLVPVRAPNINGDGALRVPRELVDNLQAAAETLKKSNYGIYISSSFRDPQKQIDLIEENCQNPPGAKSCKPKATRPPTCMMVASKPNGPPDPTKCPHTTGRALDMWATKLNERGKYERCIPSFDPCNKPGGMETCVKDPCQQALIKALGENGFCRWSKEAWHFEQPAMSKPCLKGQ